MGPLVKVFASRGGGSDCALRRVCSIYNSSSSQRVVTTFVDSTKTHHARMYLYVRMLFFLFFRSAILSTKVGVGVETVFESVNHGRRRQIWYLPKSPARHPLLYRPSVVGGLAVSDGLGCVIFCLFAVVVSQVSGRSDMGYLRDSGEGTRVDRKNIIESVDKSLMRLGTDYIDLLQVLCYCRCRGVWCTTNTSR